MSSQYAVSMRVPEVNAVDDVEASFVAGEPDALRRAYDAHGKLIYTLCRRSLGAEVAKDFTQEIFASGWFARRQYDPSRGSLGGWRLCGLRSNPARFPRGGHPLGAGGFAAPTEPWSRRPGPR